MLHLTMAAFADEASRSPEGQIAALRRNGIGLLEIRFVGDKNIAELTAEEAKGLRRRLEEEGIGVWSLGSPTGKISLRDDFSAHYDAFLHQLDLAEILGTRRCRLFSFYETDDSSACFDLICTRMERFLEAAEGRGILLCHENEKGIYGDTAERCRKLCEALPKLRAVFDPANFLQCGEAVLPAWEQLSSFVEYLHIKDCDKAGNVLLPGTGAGDLQELLARYANQGGKVVTLEPHLTKFIGLEKLEKEQRTQTQILFKNGDEAFDAAAAALRKLLEAGGTS